ncbi:MAG TPA: hypothetical protein VHM20_08810 [Gammaproteobacteria bacterium]|nr:hypothetical protein [Gammaproteobacteria bacterium]
MTHRQRLQKKRLQKYRSKFGWPDLYFYHKYLVKKDDRFKFNLARQGFHWLYG